ncbi:MAG: (deoxy)nucleoside triphosphate pyrophosphohydrolase [Lachnospiraceae bacterium]|nr:(deoxy)nucleoside triphosphate pyrophosphohydrolase [Lachnospiraceae bacterium]
MQQDFSEKTPERALQTDHQEVCPRKTIRVVAAVIRRGDAVFATARGYGAYKGGWEFPGGKIEPGETSKEALTREIREELDVEIRVGKLLKTVEYDYPKFHLSMDCFWCTLQRGEPVLKEALDARWLTAEEMDSVAWLPADKGLVDMIRGKLQ